MQILGSFFPSINTSSLPPQLQQQTIEDNNSLNNSVEVCGTSRKDDEEMDEFNNEEIPPPPPTTTNQQQQQRRASVLSLNSSKTPSNIRHRLLSYDGHISSLNISKKQNTNQQLISSNNFLFGGQHQQQSSSSKSIRSQRAPIKEIISLDDPNELEKFMSKGEEQCIQDMRTFITQFSLRQTTVALMTGVSQPYISKLLNGNHRELSLRCRKNIYCWYLNCRRHPEKLAIFVQDHPSSRLDTTAEGELVPQRRERYVFRPVLLRILDAYFQESPFPDTSKRMEIANACNAHLQLDKKSTQLMPKEVVTPQVVANWFANKRKEMRRRTNRGGGNNGKNKIKNTSKTTNNQAGGSGCGISSSTASYSSASSTSFSPTPPNSASFINKSFNGNFLEDIQNTQQQQQLINNNTVEDLLMLASQQQQQLLLLPQLLLMQQKANNNNNHLLPLTPTPSSPLFSSLEQQQQNTNLISPTLLEQFILLQQQQQTSNTTTTNIGINNNNIANNSQTVFPFFKNIHHHQQHPQLISSSLNQQTTTSPPPPPTNISDLAALHTAKLLENSAAIVAQNPQLLARLLEYS
ncbi:unnamed protein product [Meloidogyne enterolobii]|uniref:Uncharacterized protein n=1 Tax=Meloidogyne enterolobii TaxID=390850 RepID=A0ACB0YRI0_MELEN